MNDWLGSPQFYPQSKELCVILHYYTPVNAGIGFDTEMIFLMKEGDIRTSVAFLEPSEVSFILNTHFYLIWLGSENN